MGTTDLNCLATFKSSDGLGVSLYDLLGLFNGSGNLHEVVQFYFGENLPPAHANLGHFRSFLDLSFLDLMTTSAHSMCPWSQRLAFSLSSTLGPAGLGSMS